MLNFEVCFGSLFCCRSQPLFSFTLLTACITFASRISLHLVESVLSSLPLSMHSRKWLLYQLNLPVSLCDHMGVLLYLKVFLVLQILSWLTELLLFHNDSGQWKFKAESALISFHNLPWFKGLFCFIFRSSVSCLAEPVVVDCDPKVWTIREFIIPCLSSANNSHW